MRRRRGAAAAARLRSSAYFSVLLGGCLAVAAVVMRSQSAMAQNEAAETAECHKFADHLVEIGRIPEGQRTTIGSACVIRYFLCSLQEQSEQRIRSCVVQWEEQSERGASAPPRQSETPEDNEDGQLAFQGCMASFPQHTDATMKSCSEVIDAPRAGAHEKALAYAYRALVLIMRDNHDPDGRALADITKAVQIDDSVAEAYYARAEVDGNAARYEASIADIDRAVALNLPALFRPYAFYLRGLGHSMLGFLHHDKRQSQLAVDDFDQAIRLDPTSADFYHSRSSDEDRLGQTVAAQADQATADRLGRKQ